MDVLSGAQIHRRVGTPFGGPAHFFDFFLNRRCDGAVADVGVDLYQEITPDDHRLELRMIDVGGNDGAPASDFVADELWSDFVWDAGAEGVAGVLMPKVVPTAGEAVSFPVNISWEASSFPYRSVLRLLSSVLSPATFPDRD